MEDQEEEMESADIYAGNIDFLLEDDEITAGEFGFMMGYIKDSFEYS